MSYNDLMVQVSAIHEGFALLSYWWNIEKYGVRI